MSFAVQVVTGTAKHRRFLLPPQRDTATFTVACPDTAPLVSLAW